MINYDKRNDEYNFDQIKEYEYLLLNISLKYSKQRFRIIESSVFDLHTTYYTLLSSIREDDVIELKNIELSHDNVVELCEYLPHLTELHRLELVSYKMNDEDIKMMKESVQYLPNIQEVIGITKLEKRDKNEENS